MARPKAAFWIAVVVAMGALGVTPAHAEQATSCAAVVEGSRADGEDAGAPISADEIDVQVEVGHLGDGCSDRLNHAPLLLAPRLNLLVGPQSAEFDFYVTYVDLDGDAPASLTVTIDERPPLVMRPFGEPELDYRKGVLFITGVGPPYTGDDFLTLGPHRSVIRGSDGISEAEPIVIDGPFVIEGRSASVRNANPTNRFVIQPISTGPNLAPPAEVLPPLVGLAPDAPNGVYSYFFELGPMADSGLVRFSVHEGVGLRVQDPFLELGRFEARDGAKTTDQAHTGQTAVGLPGVLVAPARPDFAFVHVGFMGGYVAHDGVSAADLVLGLTLDRDLDGAADACVRTVKTLPPGDWALVGAGGSDVFEVRGADCESPLASGALVTQQGTLHELKDDIVLGMAGILDLRIASEGPLRLDDLELDATFGSSRGDIDICFYRLAEDEPLSRARPVRCVSDILGHSGMIPAGATHANVWAHTIEPILNDDFTPKRAYLEPVGFSFSYDRFVLEETPVVPPLPPGGRVELGEDLDADGVLDADEPRLARWDDVPARAGVAALEPVTVSLAGRPDGVVPLIAAYESGVDGIAPTSSAFELVRFVNDVPVAGLSALQGQGKKRIEFLLAGEDADDAQGNVAVSLGGASSWSLSFGDGDVLGGPWPLPSCVTHKYSRAGSYVAELVVADRSGATASSSLLVEVGETIDGTCGS